MKHKCVVVRLVINQPSKIPGMKFTKKILLLALFSVPVLWVQANEGGNDKKGDPSINGYVSDAESKKPVQGVTVSITGKGQDKKELITDASGNFKTNQLLPGEVTILLEKKGYRSYRKEGLVIKEGVTLRLNLDIEEDDDAGVFHPLLRMMDGE
jgi:hypothetical protein